MEEAAKALNDFGQLLTTVDGYFFGPRPCSLDAKLFGCLLFILQVPLPNNELKALLLKYNNLVSYTLRIVNDFFQ